MSELQKRNTELKEIQKEEEARRFVGAILLPRSERSYDQVAYRLLEKIVTEYGERWRYEWLTDVLNNVWVKAEEIKDFRDTTDYRQVSEESFKLWVEGVRIFFETGEMPEDLQVEENNNEDSTMETGLIHKGGGDALTTAYSIVQQKTNQLEGMQSVLALEMQSRQRALDLMKNKLSNTLTIFRKKVQKIEKVILTIELYLGVNEELVQIQEGPTADVETPLTFMQQVLYMDEEIADIDLNHGEGIDHGNLEEMDEWMRANYKDVIYGEKGVCVFSPCRNPKSYHGYDQEKAANYNYWNQVTYLLIRNGDNLYRVFTSKITIKPRLFPKRSEMQELLKNIEEAHWNSDKEKAEDLTHQYQKRALLMQGLVDRTEVFHPLPKELSMFNMEEDEQYFNFVYNDEASLPTGRLPFWKWWESINSNIQHGSRVVLTGRYIEELGYQRDNTNRIYYYVNEYNAPPFPNAGVYEVEFYQPTKILKFSIDLLAEYEEKYKNEGFKLLGTYKTFRHGIHAEARVNSGDPALTILYNPKDEVRVGGWGSYDTSERKKRIRWRIKPSDRFVFNYDMVSLDDIDFYLTSRVDRPNYLEMMPILKEFKKARLEEIENEKSFVAMLVGVFTSENLDCTEDQIWQAVEWWKNKNQIKRPIDKDDTKALRMIRKYLKKK